MAVDPNTKLAELKAKRHAVDQAIIALQQLDAVYRDKKTNLWPVPSRRSIHAVKADTSRRIA